MKRFSSSVYMFFKKLICSEMKPLDNYSTFKTLGYREYLMRCLFFLWSILWVDAVLLNNLSISWNMFWFCLKKNHFSLTRRSKIFFFGFCLTGPFYGDFTFAFGDIEIQKKSFILPKEPWKMCIFMKYWYLTSLLREKVEKKTREKIQIIHCL